MYHRLCNISKSYSFFLFGARATGKSTLLKHFIKEFQKHSLWIDLLEPELEQTLSVSPSKLLEMIDAQGASLKFVVIDEIQKVPQLLDVVHSILASRKICFALTGSSARKLKRGQANLLAGRAFQFKLHPLTFLELDKDFNLEHTLQWGSLPTLFQFRNEQDKMRYLQAYIQIYIKEEISVEQIVRKIQPFRSFLEIAAQSNGEVINFSKLARQTNIDPKNVERYFEILNDTLVGFYLEPYSRSVRKRQSQHPKFYFFDIGVVRTLTQQLDVKLKPHTYAYGRAFEHLVILEIMRLNDYLEKNFKLSYLRTKNGLEIDLILEKGTQTFLVEIKSSDKIISDDLNSLKVLGKDFTKAKKYILCLEKKARLINGTKILHWQQGMCEIFQYQPEKI